MAEHKRFLSVCLLALLLPSSLFAQDVMDELPLPPDMPELPALEGEPPVAPDAPEELSVAPASEVPALPDLPALPGEGSPAMVNTTPPAAEEELASPISPDEFDRFFESTPDLAGLGQVEPLDIDGEAATQTTATTDTGAMEPLTPELPALDGEDKAPVDTAKTDVKAEDKEVAEAEPKKRYTVRRRGSYNYKRQFLPETVYRHEYNRKNQHLPRRVSLAQYQEQMRRAAAANDVFTLRAFAEAGWDLNIRDAAGDSLVSIATRYGAVQTLRYLLLRGADPNQMNARGMTALDMAYMSRNPLLIAPLQARGAVAGRTLYAQQF